MTRFEAAALLNACLDRVTEVTDELRRLMAEFETELAILKGRVDGLEAKVGELEATQFSTTTKLKGVTFWNVGAMGNDDKNTNSEALTVNYDLRLALKTSFTGEDMLTTVLRAGNFTSTNNNFSGLTALEYGFGGSADNNVQIGRLFYTFPVGDSLTVTAGPVVRTDDPGMYAGYATYYPTDLLLDFFTYGGAWATNNLSGQGSGIGAVYEIGDSGFSVSGNYVAYNADESTGGFGTDESQSTSTWQLFYSGEAFGGNLLAQAGYAVESTANTGVGFGTAAAQTAMSGGGTGYSLAAAWQPADSGLMPSISTGFSSFDPETAGQKDVDGWYVGFEWSDVFIEGNSLGYAIGSAPNTGSADDNTIWEAFYSMPVTDNITITPAIFGVDSDGASDAEGFGGLVKTTFKF